MAVTITPITRAYSLGGTRRGQKLRAFSVAGDASKPAGGFVIAATDIGYNSIDIAMVQTPNTLYSVKMALATDSASGSLQFYAATESAVSLVGSAIGASVTDVSSQPVLMLVFGR